MELINCREVGLEVEWKGIELGLRIGLKLQKSAVVRSDFRSWHGPKSRPNWSRKLEFCSVRSFGSGPPWTEPLDRMGPVLLFCSLFLMDGFVG